jgi:hypothetical protein
MPRLAQKRGRIPPLVTVLSFVAPLRFYIFASFLFFLVLPLSGINNSTVKIANAKKIIPDQSQLITSISQTQTIGYSFSFSTWQSLAQTFKPNINGKLIYG